MNFTTPRTIGDNATQQRDSATQLSETNAKNEGGKKTLEEPTQRLELNRVRVTDNGTKSSEGCVPRAKTSKKVKTLKQPKYCGTYLVPGINTEKDPHEAGDENKD